MLLIHDLTCLFVCVCVCVYHFGGFVQVVTGEDLQWTGSDQSFGIVHSRPFKIKQNILPCD